MKMKRLNELTDSLEIFKVHSAATNPAITGLAYDSRDVKPGFLFFALKGIHSDGHQYIEKAITAGASAIIYSDNLPASAADFPAVKVTDTRKAMAPLAAVYYDNPSEKLKIIGVTGTDGKSSTVSFIAQLLSLAGYKAGLISTVSFDTGKGLQKNHLRQSTPEAPEIQKLMADMVENGLEYAVIESTSHGLSEKTSRLENICFDVAVFTNVTHEHLEFHGSVEQYRKDKSRLFQYMAHNPSPDAFGVINADDPHAELFISASGSKKSKTYSMKSVKADMIAEAVKAENEGSRFTLKYGTLEKKIFFPVPGAFNIENIMAALLAVEGILKTEMTKLLTLLPQIDGVEGRMKLVPVKAPFITMVDYAHTPGSFEKLFPSLRNQTPGKIITIFGSGGERDLEKRPIQGEIADKWVDIIILSNEDPRLEDENKILTDIAAGIKNKTTGENLHLIPDRRKAFDKAISLARENDLIIALGKGHERSIITSDGSQPWNEEKELTEALHRAGY